MSFGTVRYAQKKIWPRVRDSLDRLRANREAALHDPSATTSALARAKKPWNRAVAEETVWALAHENLLATPEQQRVVQAARDWARFYDEIEDPCAEDEALYSAVQALAADLSEISDEEVLTA